MKQLISWLVTLVLTCTIAFSSFIPPANALNPLSFSGASYTTLAMTFEDIYQFFEDPPPIDLNQEVTACYVLSILLNGESYGTELIQILEREYPDYRLSDTVLYSTLRFLESQRTIQAYWRKVEGAGRPRRMYKVNKELQSKAEELAQLWYEYIKRG